MSIKKITVGSTVTTRKGKDAIVYTVKSIEEGMALLTYKDGDRTFSGGRFPVSCLYLI